MLRRPSSSLLQPVLRRFTAVASASSTFSPSSTTTTLLLSRRFFSATPVCLADGDQQQQQQQQQQDQKPKFSLPSWTDPNSKDLYMRLGLKKDAPLDEIKKHYRHLSKMYHPDANKAAGAEQKFLNVKEAYETLSDTQKRNVYDSTGASWSQQEQYQRAGGGAGGNPFQGMYGSSFVWSNRSVNPRLTRGLMLVVFFSFGLALSALMELRARRYGDARKMSDQQAELAKQRSSLWRPFFGIMLFIAMLPRLPATILVWYFYAYLPTIRAEDRAAKDPTVIVKDELNGKAFHVKLWSPFLEGLSRNAASAGGAGLDHIFVVSVQPDDSRLTLQQQNELRDTISKMSPAQVQQMMGVTEFPASVLNNWEMSVPKPHLFIKSLGGMVPVPCQVKLKVKTLVRDSNGRIAPERGELIYEKQFDC